MNGQIQTGKGTGKNNMYLPWDWGTFFLSKISTFASRKATFLSSRQSFELRAANRPEQLMEKAFRNSVIRLIEPKNYIVVIK